MPKSISYYVINWTMNMQFELNISIIFLNSSEKKEQKTIELKMIDSSLETQNSLFDSDSGSR